jgi:DNA-binding NtrC family response regulator
MDPIKILIVDDEERFRITLGKLLASHGLSVKDVGSGQEALDELAREPYDIVLLDVKMPGMSGTEVLPRIKALDPAIEVIVLTGHASVDIAAELIAHGAADYLVKPYRIQELLDIIAVANDRRKATRRVHG